MGDITQKEVRFLHAFLWGGLGAAVLLLMTVIFTGPPTEHNEMFLQSIVAWQQPGYLATHDFRHYVTGIFLFSLLPIGIFFVLRTISLLPSVGKRARQLLLGIMGSLGIVFLGVVLSRLTSLLPAISMFLSTTHRGKQLQANGLLLLLTIIIWFIVFLYIYRPRYRLRSYTLPKLPREIPFRYHAALLGFCILLILNPRYTSSFESLSKYGGEASHQFHHVISYIGPIHDVMKGKTLLISADAQYGYLATYIPATIFSLFGLSFAGFTLYVMGVAVLYVMGVYLFLLCITNRWYWAFLGTTLYIRLAYFRAPLLTEIYTYPSITPLRYGIDIFVLLSIVWSQKHPSWKASLLTACLVGCSLFYNIEIGASILLAYGGMIAGTFFFHRNIKQSLRDIALLLCAILVFSGSIAAFTFLSTAQWPDFWRLGLYIFYFGRGYFDLPMPLVGAYYIPLCIYFMTYASIVFDYMRKSTHLLRIRIFLLIYGLCSFVYYLGFSEPNHLFAVLHPSVFLAIILVHRAYRQRYALRQLPILFRSLLITSLMVGIGFSIGHPKHLVQDIKNKVSSRYLPQRQHYLYWPYPGTYFSLTDNDGRAFALATKKIHQYSSTNDILVLSRYDTLLLIMAGKTSIIPYSYLEYGIIYQRDIERAIAQIKEASPEYVFVAREPYTHTETDNIEKIWSGIHQLYTYQEPAGTVDVYRRRG